MTPEPTTPSQSPAPAPIEVTHRLTVPPHVYSRPFGEQVVLLDFGQGDYYGLDEVGSVLWTTVEGGGCVGDAVSHVLAQFEGASQEQVTQDLLALAADLLARGLVERA